MIYLSFFVSLKSIHLLGRLELIISGPILPKLSPASVRLRCIPEDVPPAFPPRRPPDGRPSPPDDGPELPKWNPPADDFENSETRRANRSVDSSRRTKDDASADVMSDGASPEAVVDEDGG